ncbi:MAG: hypothetical protein IKE90_04240 [Bacilli bacterium]|nr:hypothetical protein [Bacilli bacterium]
MYTKELVDKVNTFCQKQTEQVTTIEKNFIINKVLEIANDIIKNTNKTSDEIDSVLKSLLIDSNLNTQLSASHEFYRKYLNTVKEDLNTTNSHRFWKDVFTSIFASFIYSVMVALIIYFGRDEFGNFVNSLFNK